MDENINKRPRPRRDISARGNDEQKPQKNPAVQRPVEPPKPAATPLSQPSQSADDNEKTRLTDMQPKAPLKTPVRKEKERKNEVPSALGGVFKALLYITAVLIVSVVCAYFIIQFANDVFAFVKPEEEVEVVIPPDATVSDVADILGKGGVIKYPTLFKLYAKLMEEDGVDEDGNSVFIAGTYTVSPMKNYMQLLPYFMEKSKPREVVWVTFPEGSSIKEMIDILVDDYGIASREAFEAAINDYDYGFDFLEGLDALEGRYYRLEGYVSGKRYPSRR